MDTDSRVNLNICSCMEMKKEFNKSLRFSLLLEVNGFDLPLAVGCGFDNNEECVKLFQYSHNEGKYVFNSKVVVKNCIKVMSYLYGIATITESVSVEDGASAFFFHYYNIDDQNELSPPERIEFRWVHSNHLDQNRILCIKDLEFIDRGPVENDFTFVCNHININLEKEKKKEEKNYLASLGFFKVTSIRQIFEINKTVYNVEKIWNLKYSTFWSDLGGQKIKDFYETVPYQIIRNYDNKDNHLILIGADEDESCGFLGISKKRIFQVKIFDTKFPNENRIIDFGHFTPLQKNLYYEYHKFPLKQIVVDKIVPQNEIIPLNEVKKNEQLEIKQFRIITSSYDGRVLFYNLKIIRSSTGDIEIVSNYWRREKSKNLSPHFPVIARVDNLNKNIYLIGGYVGEKRKEDVRHSRGSDLMMESVFHHIVFNSYNLGAVKYKRREVNVEKLKFSTKFSAYPCLQSLHRISDSIIAITTLGGVINLYQKNIVLVDESSPEPDSLTSFNESFTLDDNKYLEEIRNLKSIIRELEEKVKTLQLTRSDTSFRDRKKLEYPLEYLDCFMCSKKIEKKDIREENGTLRIHHNTCQNFGDRAIDYKSMKFFHSPNRSNEIRHKIGSDVFTKRRIFCKECGKWFCTEQMMLFDKNSVLVLGKEKTCEEGEEGEGEEEEEEEIVDDDKDDEKEEEEVEGEEEEEEIVDDGSDDENEKEGEKEEEVEGEEEEEEIVDDGSDDENEEEGEEEEEEEIVDDGSDDDDEEEEDEEEEEEEEGEDDESCD